VKIPETTRLVVEVIEFIFLVVVVVALDALDKETFGGLVVEVFDGSVVEVFGRLVVVDDCPDVSGAGEVTTVSMV